ncbi:MAG: PAS domain S-box protein [Acetobacteraceae bacterium]|nr:PAS domain S-box protein [Acetobacteraceae bacterium]
MSAAPLPADPLPTLDHDFLVGGGEMGGLMRSLDWSRTALGPVASWPQSLRTSVSTCLNCAFPILLWWGPELVMLYNDEYAPILGVKHPAAMGQRGAECWPEIWDVIGPMLRQVLDEGQPTRSRDLLLMLNRDGYDEECYFSFSYSPIRDETGQVGGVFTPVIETTPKVVGERRLRTLRDLAARNLEAPDAGTALGQAASVLAENPHDLPFAVLYLIGPDRGRAELAGAAGLTAGSAACPVTLALDAGGPWPEASRAARRGEAVLASDLPARFGAAFSTEPWDVPPRQALVMPVILPGASHPAALLVAGLSERRALDASYREFLGLVAGQIGTALGGALARDEERRRAEALAELDRAKTAFFANVSHEFRTPLTLLLGPLEEMLGGPGHPLPQAAREQVELVHRNAMRLLRLVNALLDFSRVEAGRARASFAPIELAVLTADLASTFRSLCERAGLALDVDCPALPKPVFVDQDMWEKVVLNLLSNAFKFTHEGSIHVSLHPSADGNAAELRVRDTGIGIAPADLPRLFERFHRVEGAVSRSHEGTGIGLALVDELVRLHGGSISVESEPGRGTAFTVQVPFGSAHLPADQIGTAPNLSQSAQRVRSYAEEAMRWLPAANGPGANEADAEPVLAGANRPRILLADDNADMRAYVGRLLAGQYAIEAVADGEAALTAALGGEPPDLVLSDVMMPGLDGIALTAALRADPRTALVPIILLSARAGEEAQVEGIGVGADDYLVKPFSARELLARIKGNMELGRARRQAAAREQRLRAEADMMRTRIETMIEHMPVGAVLFDTTGRILVSNAPYRRYVPGALVPSQDPVAHERWIGFHPDGRRFAASDLPSACALRGEVIRAQELRFRDDDGVERWTQVSASPVHGADGAIVGAVTVIVDTDEARRATAALRESEERFRVAADSAPILIWMTDAEPRATFWNRQYEELFGRPASDLRDDIWRQVVHPDDVNSLLAGFRDAFQRRARFSREVRVFDRDGRLRWLRAEGVPRYDGVDNFLGYTGCAFDVTDSKEATARQHLLIAELNHRVKNTLATVQSLAQQSMRSTDAPPGFATAFSSRLLALARAHDLLTREEWDGATLADVAAAALAPWLDGGRITMEGARIRLVPKHALALSMALGELATNAVKHGALSVPAGQVSLAWKQDGEGAVVLEWIENGGPVVRPPVRRGLGSRLLGRPLAAELGGTVDVRFDPAGVRCVIGFPVSARATA